ncbi:uncharacterized protein LOC126895479 [Daktulosphaira vitifoliae]|uniref:uncharacterized protein LOC126895479 n=1 Tax=Daktulosphaira vitifoliae TaxID=58002 RepID=UPI0021AA1A92|nr:uncharacterized protein LOC126895479 [Daktulosphaira vitifoliae]
MAMKRAIDFHLNEPTQQKKTNLFQAIKDEANGDSVSDDESVDAATDVFPLGHYIDNPEELIKQMFSVIRGKRLARLIPPELKDLTFEELKTDCLIQLLGMSKKRVLGVLKGKELDSSSDSDDSLIFEKKKMNETNKKSHKRKKNKIKKPKVRLNSDSESEKTSLKEGNTLLEILQLEMRAKAIRELLEPEKNSDDSINFENVRNKTIAEDKKSEEVKETKSWSERYEEREDVKEVVKTSKLCTSIRKRMLLHQQKLLAEKAKLKAEELEHVNFGDAIKAKSDEKLQKLLSSIGDENLKLGKQNLKPIDITTMDKNQELLEIKLPDEEACMVANQPKP